MKRPHNPVQRMFMAGGAAATSKARRSTRARVVLRVVVAFAVAARLSARGRRGGRGGGMGEAVTSGIGGACRAAGGSLKAGSECMGACSIVGGSRKAVAGDAPSVTRHTMTGIPRIGVPGKVIPRTVLPMSDVLITPSFRATFYAGVADASETKILSCVVCGDLRRGSRPDDGAWPFAIGVNCRSWE